MRTWIKNGLVVDPKKGRMENLDVIINGDRIEKLVESGSIKAGEEFDEILDASGKLVVPGLVDMHVHLREPGFEYKETIATGARAAVAGGFTTIACMPNTFPPNDSRSVTEFIVEQAKRAGMAKVLPIAAITIEQKGERLTEFGDLKEAGAVGVSDDGFPVKNSELMRRAIEYARFHGLTIISHCEDSWLSEGGVMHEGEISTRIGLRGIPGASEEIYVYREISLARLTGCPVHIAHVSTAESVELIRRAKQQGILVTAETTPHYFTLDHTAVMGYDTNAKVNPPLRTPHDVEAVKAGLADGTIDAIATDHAPHSDLEKEVEFDQAAFGMIGLQTALPLTLRLVEQGIISLVEAFRKLSLNPAKILGIQGGTMEENSSADITIIDPDFEYTFTEDMILSKSKNSPFIGQTLKGIAQVTISGGKIVWRK